MGETGSIQSWDPEQYAKNARFVADLGMPVLALLAPKPGEAILDLGCGDGALTVKLVEAGATVVAVDSSAAQIAAARAQGLDAEVMDGQALTFTDQFDAVFSNAALHWMPEPDAVLGGVRRALKPGGRFVAEFGGHMNVAAVVVALTAALRNRGVTKRKVTPWYFPSPAEYRARLEAHGFNVESIELIPRPTPLPGHIDGWLDTFAESLFAQVPPADRKAMRAEVVDLLEPVLRDGEGNWTTDYMRLRVRATLS